MADVFSGSPPKPKTSQLLDSMSVSNVNHVYKFGRNPDMDNNSEPEDVWSFGGLYTFMTSAQSLFISSSSASDTQDIILQGLDNDWNFQSVSVTLSGQTKTPISGTWLRVFRAFNNGSTNTQGTIYIYEDTTPSGGVPGDSFIRAGFSTESQQTQMAIYSVAADRTAYLHNFIANIYREGGDSALRFQLLIRPFGGVFREQGQYSVNTQGTSTFDYTFPYPLKINPKSDILFRCLEVENNNTALSINFDLSEILK